MGNEELNVIDTNVSADKDFENDLTGINLSYVDDDNKIVEPVIEEVIAKPQVTVNDEGDITSVAFVEENKDSENAKAMPQFIFGKDGTVIAVQYNSEPVVNGDDVVRDVTPRFTFDDGDAITSISLVDKEKNSDDNTIKAPKISFDENGVVTNVSLDEEENANKNDDKVISKVLFDENGVVVGITFAGDNIEDTKAPKITFDENGIVTSISNNEEIIKPFSEDFKFEPTDILSLNTDGEVEKTDAKKLSSEEEEIIADINSNRQKINEEMEKFNDIVKQAHELGIADSNYLKDTFDKVEVFDSINQKFNEDTDKYVESISDSDSSENDSDLDHIEF